MECAEVTADQPTDGGEPRYKALIDNLYEGVVVCEAIRDAAGRLTDYWLRYANPVFVRRAPAGEARVDRRMSEIRPETPPAWFAACQRALEGDPVRFEFQEARSQRWYEVHMIRLSDREFGQLYVDVTRHKIAEQRQTDQVKELNHRVKNNLAVVASILELQARGSSPEVREHLTRAVDRVQSIAVLHEALYRQEGGEQVDLAAYLEQLAAQMERSLLAASGIRLSVACEPVDCAVREAVNIGLIVNELVTNSAKHAYGPSGGPVRVAVTAHESELRLVVSDDGPGLPSHPAARGGLGLRLVRSLAEGLGGKVTTGSGPGGRVEVSLRLGAVGPAESQQQALL
jgi:two-component sensor histidine kinase